MTSCGILFSNSLEDLSVMRKSLRINGKIRYASNLQAVDNIINQFGSQIIFARKNRLSEKEMADFKDRNCKIFDFSSVYELEELFKSISDKDFEQNTKVQIQNPTSFSTLIELSPTFSRLVGNSTAMQKLRKKILKIASSDISVLILGETGTGKTTDARTIHELSERRNMSFKDSVLSNSNEALIESKLFGVSKGGFTGAVETKGLFEEASDGTLFLDEIGEISINMQTKLLQVLSERMINRIGSNKDIAVNPRMIFATNANLKKKIREGVFREDLFYRINEVSLKIPPLRERVEDIPEICHSYFKREKIQKKISEPALRLLQTFPWKGNIRQLEKCLKTAAFLYSDSDIIEPKDIKITEI